MHPRLPSLLPAALLATTTACASLGAHGGGDAVADRDRVVTVSPRDARDVVVLVGAPVQMRSGSFERHGDSTVVRGTGVAMLPDGAFRLRVNAVPADGGAPSGDRGRVVLEFSTAGSDGHPMRVRADGRGITLHRGADGRTLMLDAETVDVQSRPIR